MELFVGNLEVLFFFFDVSGIFVDYLILEGCVFGERFVFEGFFFEDKKGFINFKLIESVKGGDVDLIVEFEKCNVLDIIEINNGCGLYIIGNGKGECVFCENIELG